MDSNKTGDYLNLQKGGGGSLSYIRSEIYNSVKYGLKGMRHRNANMYVARK